MRPPARPPGPPPDEAALRQAALTHLARYGTTQAGLLRVLARRVQRWVRAADAPAEQAEQAMTAARAVVARLAEVGAVDDALFAESRTRSLHRAGRSRRAITAHLQAKGVPSELATPPDDPAAELEAALLYASRRRIGPFRPESGPSPDPAHRMRDLARLARAGFTAAIAGRALSLSTGEAEAVVLRARRS